MRCLSLLSLSALKFVHQGITLEHLSLTVQIYLRMDRPDLASRSLLLMQQADEDSVLTSLSLSWVAIKEGGAKTEEGVYALQTLGEQYGPSVMMLNALAGARITMGEWGKAGGNLEDALTLAEEREDSGDGTTPPELADTLINLAAVRARTGGGGDVVERIKREFPKHPYVEMLERVEGAIERVGQGFN